MNTLSLPATLLNRWKIWGKRENQRTTQRVTPPRRWYVFTLLALLSASVATVKGWPLVSRYIQQHPYFAVSDIDVDLDASALFAPEELTVVSGMAPGMNLWTVDPECVRERLLAVPGIQDVEVRREFPQRVVLQVQTRHPIAVIVQPSLTYIDKEGIWFTAPAQRQELDLPYVTGLNQDDLASATARTALTGVVSLLSLAAKLWAEPLSEIHWDQKAGYTVFLAHRRLSIRLGEDIGPEKFAQVATVLTQWSGDSPPALFDARFFNQVVVRPFVDQRGQRPTTPADSL